MLTLQVDGKRATTPSQKIPKPKHRVLLPCLVIASAVVMAVRAKLVINGWYNCSANTFGAAAQNDSSGLMRSGTSFKAPPATQCALIQAPLCHQDVCTSNKTIKLFVKRMLSSTSSPKAVPDIWFVQGGPGASSEGMETGMQDLMAARNGKVNVYTLDHRGTGRSNKLDCVAAQATTSGSPGGERITAQEFAACSADLANEYGDDLSAFSITSAASDIAILIKELKSNADSFVYGVSYGTAVVERLIHLNVTGIAGYVLDGVATCSGATSAEKFEYFSTWDDDFGMTGDRFLELCKKDPFCGGKFGSRGPAQTLRDLYARFDASAEAATCTGIAFERLERMTTPTASVSVILRKLLGAILMRNNRMILPALIYRMDRCSTEDRKVLQQVFNPMVQGPQVPQSVYTSSLLYQLITYSEMWEVPPPRQQVLQKRLTDQLITSGESVDDLASNCLYRMDKESPACQELQLDWDSLPNGTRPIAYARDQFWNVSAKVPEGASVLILNGKLDTQTHYRYAQYLYEALDATPEQKKLLLFEYLAHGTLYIRDKLNDFPCALKIMASYVEKRGKLAAINTECMQHQAPITFELDSTESLVMSTDDAYDGKLLTSSTHGHRDHHESPSFTTPFILLLVLLGIGVIVLGIVLYRLRRIRRLMEEDKYMELTDGSDQPSERSEEAHE